MPTEVADDGLVQFELRLSDRNSVGTWNFTAVYRDGKWIDTKSLGRDIIGHENVTLDLGSATGVSENAPITDAIDDNGNPVSSAQGGFAVSTLPVALPSNASTTSSGSWTCKSTGLEWETARNERFTRVSSRPGSPATITQKYGTDHTLGIGIKAEGAASYEQSGSSTISLNASPSRTVNYPYFVFNQVNYRKFKVYCWYSDGYGYWDYTEYHRRPQSVYDLLSRFDSISNPAYPYCSSTKYSGTYTKYRERTPL